MNTVCQPLCSRESKSDQYAKPRNIYVRSDATAIRNFERTDTSLELLEDDYHLASLVDSQVVL